MVSISETWNTMDKLASLLASVSFLASVFLSPTPCPFIPFFFNRVQPKNFRNKNTPCYDVEPIISKTDIPQYHDAQLIISDIDIP